LRLIDRTGQALPDQITVLFRKKKVERLTKTHIILWNSGKATVKGENIVGDDPLRLQFDKDAEVLSVRVVTVTRNSIKFAANINPDASNEVLCSFDYLDEQDGATVEVLHTGEERYPEVLGSIRGIPKGLLDWGHIFPSPEPKAFPFPPIGLKIAAIAGLVGSLFFVIFGLFEPLMPAFLTSEPEAPRWVFIVFGLIFIGFFSFFLWITRRRFPKSLSVEDIE
jgi:hypothetical protein